jgi:hypothetical protein
MNTNKKITIAEFDEKRFQPKLVKPNDNKKAVLTHYFITLIMGV